MQVISPSTYRGGSALSRAWQWLRGERGIVNTRRWSFFGSSDPTIHVDENNLWQAYLDCPHLNVVINRVAELARNGQWKVVDEDDETVEHEDDEALDLLRQPNPLHNAEEFLYQYFVYHGVFHNTFTYKLKATSVSQPMALWGLQPDLMEIKFTGKFYKQLKVEDVVKEYLFDGGGKQDIIPIDEIIWKATNRDASLIGQSKIIGLKLPISNIVAALHTRNKLIVDKGIVGILSSAASEGGMAIPLGDEERTRVERDFAERANLYSGKAPFHMTNASVNWQSMSYPVRDLMLLEECEDDFGQIIAAYGLDRDIFPSTKGATFENKEMGTKSSYENGVIPIADDLANTLTKELGLQERGRKLILDYTWLPVMQEDQQKSALTYKTKIEALHTQFADGALTQAEYRLELGKDPLPEKDALLSQEESIRNAQVELRGTVGGTTALVEVNTAVAEGRMDRDAAVAIIVNIFGFEQSVAETMVTRTVKPPEPKVVSINQTNQAADQAA